MRFVLGEQARQQDVVEFFLRSAQTGDPAGLAAVWAFGGFVAPLVEEVLFRGYLHGAFKRFGGRWVATLAGAAVFGAIHGNLAAAVPLAVLAICLALAYEAAGSLWVPILMHAGFNLAMLLLLQFSGGAFAG
jgi:hypothetical protein